MHTVHIEPRGYDADAAAEAILKVLRARRGGPLTPEEASVLSGTPLHSCEAGLLVLAGRFNARLDVTSDGQLRFHFGALRDPDRALTRRLRALAERAAPAAHGAATWIAWWLIIILVMATMTNIAALGSGPMADGGKANALYTVGTLLTMIPAIVLVFSAFPFALIAFWFVELPNAIEHGVGRTVSHIFAMGGVVAGLSYMYYRMSRALLGWLSRSAEPLPALRALFLGPPRPRVDALADERRLTRFIATSNGVVTKLDLMALFGWTPAEADAAIVRILLAYGGDIEVSEGGGLLFVFPSLAAARDATTAPWRNIDARVRAPRFAGAHPNFARFMLILLGVGLLLLAIGPPHRVTPGLDDLAANYSEREDPLDLLFRPGLGIWPHLVVGLWMAVRAAIWLRDRHRAEARERRHALIRAIISDPEHVDTREAHWTSHDLATFGASPPEDANAHMVAFPEHAAALAAAPARRQALANTNPSSAEA